MRGKSFARLAVTFALFFSAALASGQVLTQIRDSGSRANRINIVILSEGYTAGAELDTKFPADAVAKMNGFLNADPYKEYAPYINVFTIAVASAESGSDHPSLNQFKNTYFNSTYDSFGQDRLLTIPPNDRDGDAANGQGKVDALLMQLVPDFDQVLMVVNDTQYGGSGGPVSIASVNGSATEILIHEIGHTFADLADEYDTAAPQITPVEKPNATQQTTRAQIKWNIWILPNTPIPTPEDEATYGGVIGLFEGANYNTTGWYRPKFKCKMNVLDVPFCSVCAEALVLNIYKRIKLSDSASPDPSAGVTITNTETKAFSVTPLKPATHSLSIQWFLDNAAVQGATTETYNFAGSGVAVGQHTLRVDLRDQTPFVRNDPANNLAQSITWTVNVADPNAAPGRLLNIATRLRVQTAENALIGGFIVTGNEQKKVLIRGIGPSLAQFFPGVLANPTLELFQGNTLLANNDDWRDTQEQEIQATTIPPSNNLESAIVRTLAPGNYTAILRGKDNTTGIGLIEAYDLNQTANSRLANIATRGFVEPGDNVMIGGFIVGGNGGSTARVLVRAIGPSLVQAGVANALANPTLELRDVNGALLEANDDWRTNNQAEIQATTIPPSNDLESAIVRTLTPGNYTAIVRGTGTGTGIGLVEVYNLQ